MGTRLVLVGLISIAATARLLGGLSGDIRAPSSNAVLRVYEAFESQAMPQNRDYFKW